MSNYFLEDVQRGLSKNPKTIPSKYFYDQRGSELFERITKLEEYYLTECEREIILNQLPGALKALGECLNIVELGAGDGTKTVDLLQSVENSITSIDYHAFDISFGALQRLSQRLKVLPSKINRHYSVVDFSKGIELVTCDKSRRNVLLFLGSSIGNMTLCDSINFLKSLSEKLNPGDRWLIGFDLVKEKTILENAYNDSQGVTRDFNLNLLMRMNAELQADFDINSFEHVEYFDEKISSMVSFLQSNKRQSVKIGKAGICIELQENEKIHTEYSFKYTDQMIQKISEESDLKIVWNGEDKRGYYRLVMMEK
ncbi:MAG: L-histidine N(alpha)-methyltransferase [Bacteriovoracaceae bacterium]